ncbi:hypothetical protein NHJ13734_009882 [Beauveria thailandica]
MVANPMPLQKLSGVRAIHGMLWDQQGRTLWVAGNTDRADGRGGKSFGIVQGYKYDQSSKRLTRSTNYTMNSARQLDTEWQGTGTGFEKWWDGAHDLVPVPSTRILLVPMDRDICAIDLSTGQFNYSGPKLAAKYLRGFRPLGDRKGYNGEVLPRSDIKSISILPDGAALYVQAPWQASSGLGKQVNLLSSSGKHEPLYKGQTVYRSRWFLEVPGWPAA